MCSGLRPVAPPPARPQVRSPGSAPADAAGVARPGWYLLGKCVSWPGQPPGPVQRRASHLQACLCASPQVPAPSQPIAAPTPPRAAGAASFHESFVSGRTGGVRGTPRWGTNKRTSDGSQNYTAGHLTHRRRSPHRRTDPAVAAVAAGGRAYQQPSQCPRLPPSQATAQNQPRTNVWLGVPTTVRNGEQPTHTTNGSGDVNTGAATEGTVWKVFRGRGSLSSSCC